MSSHADEATANPIGTATLSQDGGLTWSELMETQYGKTNLILPTGELRILPHYLWPDGTGLKGPCLSLGRGAPIIRVVEDGVRVAGWPRAVGTLKRELGLGGFVFNGQTLRLKSGAYFGVLYGLFEGDKFYSLLGAESEDGSGWKIRSLIADVSCGFKGSGPSEAAVCRLNDGRLMYVFRNDGTLPYGQTWSSDEGMTWEKPIEMKNVRSVQPSLVVLEGGEVVLTGGRPGVFMWINADGSGKTWQTIDLGAHHNANWPKELVNEVGSGGPGRRTTSYTEVVSLGGGELIVIYDRVGNGWKPIPEESKETNSVWVVKVRVVRGE
jgi:hypothetical protein